MAFQLSLVVRNAQVKSVKDELERCNLFDKQQKIRDVVRGAGEPQFKLLPTKLTFPKRSSSSEGEGFVKNHTDLKVSGRVEGYAYCPTNGQLTPTSRQQTANPLRLAVAQAINSLPSDSEQVTTINKAALIAQCPSSYNLYGPLLLLPAPLESQPCWKQFLTSEEAKSYRSAVLTKLVSEMSVKCIAISRPVLAANEDQSDNVMRSPSKLIEIHGDFGPSLPPYPEHVPTREDFDQAFWAEVRQHSIVQTWAPRYTMFSQGNVTEKGRILTMPSVATANLQSPWTAVDLFAGIGYFALSYAKAGATKVLGWDINPWSIEGLRRGALANGHTVRVVPAQQENTLVTAGAERFLVFNESNVHAVKRIAQLRLEIPPVRHVNCGMLPTSAMAWKTAVTLLDPIRAGWIHIHESAFENEIDQRVAIIRDQVQAQLEELSLPMNLVIRGLRRLGRPAAADYMQEELDNIHVDVERVVTVKSMAARLNHYVIDIRIPSLPDPMFAERSFGMDPPVTDDYPLQLARAVQAEKMADLEAMLEEQEKRLEGASPEEVEAYIAALRQSMPGQPVV